MASTERRGSTPIRFFRCISNPALVSALCVLAGVLLWCFRLDAQEGILVARSDHAVTAGGPEFPLTEPFLAVNPSDPAHLIVGAIVAPASDGAPWRCAVLASFDDGVTWQRVDFDMERCIDPWVVFTTAGDVQFVGIELLRGVDGDARFHLVSFRSQDGGLTWSGAPTSLGRAHEHAMLAVDRSRPRGAVYLTSRRMRRTPAGEPRHTVYVARSRDEGRTFTSLAELRPSNLALNPTGLGFLTDGTLVISFYDFQRNVDGFKERGMLANARAWIYRSEDGGESFSAPVLIAEECASGVEGSFPGYPFLAVDTSAGAYRDRLYHVCVRPGYDGVAFSYSADGGERWSNPLSVDRQVDGGPAHVRTPMLAVNDAGIVGVAWYDRRHDPDRQCQDLYFTASRDGGATFAQPVRISTATSCPNVQGNGRAARSWPAGGDYSSLATGADGRFHVIWADSRSGRFALRHAAIRVTESTRPEGSRR